jgi:hypothetical protein
MRNYIILSLLALATGFTACTKEDEESMSAPAIKTSDLKFSVTQETGHDNIVYLNSSTAGSFIPLWQYAGDFSKKTNDTVMIPFGGTYWVRYSVYTNGGPVADSSQITVSQNDPEYFNSRYWKLLTDTGKGVTWVWAVDVPTKYCYGNGPGDATTPQWWTNGASYLDQQGVLNDEFTFDLEGAKNFTFNHNGTVTKAKFDVDTTAGTVKITGSDLPLGTKATYTIVLLDENQLTLVEQGAGWRNIWLFKRKGYSYN